MSEPISLDSNESITKFKAVLEELPDMMKKASARIEILHGFALNYLALYEEQYRASVKLSAEQTQNYLECARFMWRTHGWESELLKEVLLKHHDSFTK